MRSTRCKVQETNTTNEAMLDSLIKKQEFKDKEINDSQCWIGIIHRKKKRIKRGTSLGLYTGRRIRNKKLDKYYPETGLAPYTICESRRDDAQCINVSYSTDGAPHYANDKKSLRHTNMNIQDGKKKKKYLPKAFTTKNIDPHKEILLWKKLLELLKLSQNQEILLIILLFTPKNHQFNHRMKPINYSFTYQSRSR